MAKEKEFVEELAVEKPVLKCVPTSKTHTYKIVGEKYVVTDPQGNIETIGSKEEFEARFKAIN